MSDDRYFQVVSIKVNDASLFQRYVEAAGPVVARYGGDLERMLAPSQVQGEGVDIPDLVNIVYYDSKDAFESFERDPDFLAIKEMRTEAIDMISLEGAATAGGLVEGGEQGRLYLVEIASFGAGGAEAHRRYHQESEDFLAPFGFHLEREISVDTASGLVPFVPDVVRVTYFDDETGLERAETDPGHSSIEQAYSGAVAESVWLVGRIHQASLAQDG